MIERRDLLKIGVAAPLALALPASLRAAGEAAALWVIDARYNPDAASGPRTAVLRGGDVTPLWTDRLDAAWRGRGATIAGTTGSDALFVLEQLAWHRGRRVTARREIAPAAQGRPALIAWVIAPHHPSVTA